MSNNDKNQSQLNKELNKNNEPNKIKLNNSEDQNIDKQTDNPSGKSDSKYNNFNPSPRNPSSLPYILELVASDPELQQQAIVNALEKIYNKLDVDIKEFHKLKTILKHKGELWSLEKAKDCLSMLVFNAAFGKPSYIKHGEVVAKLSEIDDKTREKLLE